MLNFIHANLAPIAASGMLVGMFAWVVYLNVAYSNEKKQEALRLSTEPCHGTCQYDNLNKGDANKVVDVVAECLGKIAGSLINHALDQRAAK
jgi:hypothetical protein